MPGTLIPDGGFIHSIREKGSPVKQKYESVTETQQFKRWFGDWRSYDKQSKEVVTVQTINISEASLTHGDYEIADTNWTVHAGKVLNDDTRHHTGEERSM